MICVYSTKEISWAHPWRRYVLAMREIGIECIDVNDLDKMPLVGEPVITVGSWNFEDPQRIADHAAKWSHVIHFHDDWLGGLASQVRRAIKDKPNVMISQIVDWKDKKRPAYYVDEHVVNLNALSNTGRRLAAPRTDCLFYYGAFREKRIAVLQKYPGMLVSSSARGQNKFSDAGFVSIPRVELELLGNWSRHLYAEDVAKNYPVHFPSNRLFEVWCSGAAIFFDSSTKMHGFDPWPVVNSMEDVMSYDWREVADTQSSWKLPTREDTVNRLKEILCK